MIPERSNIVLIGMAGCGKSSVGKMLANMLNMGFLDTDELIITNQNRPLQAIIDTEGPMGFRCIEEKVLLSVEVENHVVATGGSSIYSGSGMQHLKERGVVVLLQADLVTLQERVGDTADRGLVKQSGQCFEDLFRERRPLYDGMLK